MASPPASLISRSTVLMVDCGELGFGGNGTVLLASEVVFAATTTNSYFVRWICSRNCGKPTGISLASQINGNLSPYAARRSDDEGHLLFCCHFTVCLFSWTRCFLFEFLRRKVKQDICRLLKTSKYYPLLITRSSLDLCTSSRGTIDRE